jgi:hypothetical protein
MGPLARYALRSGSAYELPELPDHAGARLESAYDEPHALAAARVTRARIAGAFFITLGYGRARASI